MMLAWDARALSGKDLDGNGRRPICGLQSYAQDGDINQRLGFTMAVGRECLWVVGAVKAW